MDTVILDPVIPYVGPIGGGSFSHKKLVILEGAVLPHAYGFDINFQCGPNTYPHDDIALQISVRFLHGYISLNSSQQGTWGKEIRLSNVHIEADQKFKISVLCEFNQYKVDINDENYCIFPQRISCEKVNHLSIEGDVSITRISHESICNSISDSTTAFASNINKFNYVQQLPPSHKATLKNGCKNYLIFLCVIAVIILIGYFIIRIALYANNDTSYTYDIPSIDLKAIDQDMDKTFKEVQDAMEDQKLMDEENQKFNDILANSKKMDESNTFVYDFVQSPDIID